MDIIYLHGLSVECVIGIWEWERRVRQRVTIDLDMGADVAAAAREDRIASTLDYKAVAKRVRAFVSESDFQLVETLAERVAALLQDEFAIPWVRVRINKPGAIRGARDVGVVIERGARTGGR